MFHAMLRIFLVAFCLGWATLTHAHVVLTYPQWRGNNLGLNDTFPFGMQWMYPCGGLPVTTNRTHWPINGGAVAFQPGWLLGHETALIYINIGLGAQPVNYSWPITKIFIQGPTNDPYPGTVCLPQLTLPDAVKSQIKDGDLASIQVIEAAKHGAGLFSCADIIFTADGSEVPTVNEQNCFNTSTIKISDVDILGEQQLPSACSSLSASVAARTAATPTASGDVWGWSCANATGGRSQLFSTQGPDLCSSVTAATGSPSSTSATKNGAVNAVGSIGAAVVVSLMSTALLLLGNV